MAQPAAATNPCSQQVARPRTRPAGAMARLEIALVCLGGVLALTISLAHWHTMNPDALSYLEVGEAWWRGDFGNAVNGYWSPLYPILIAGFAKLAPTQLPDVAFAHLSAVPVFVAAFFSLRWLLQEAEKRIDPAPDDTMQFNFRLVSYAVFFWGCFCLMDVRELLPDLLLTVWMLLAGASILRMETHGW